MEYKPSKFKGNVNSKKMESMSYRLWRAGPNRMFRKAFWAQNGNTKPKVERKVKSTQQSSQEMLIFKTEQEQSFFLSKKREMKIFKIA